MNPTKLYDKYVQSDLPHKIWGIWDIWGTWGTWGTWDIHY